MFAIAFEFSAAGVLSWTPPKNVRFIGAGGNAVAVITTDPAITTSGQITGPTTSQIAYDVLWMNSAATTTHPNTEVNVNAGTTVFVVSGGQGTLVTYWH
jgi:hypothetical protein